MDIPHGPCSRLRIEFDRNPIIHPPRAAHVYGDTPLCIKPSIFKTCLQFSNIPKSTRWDKFRTEHTKFPYMANVATGILDVIVNVKEEITMTQSFSFYCLPLILDIEVCNFRP